MDNVRTRACFAAGCLAALGLAACGSQGQDEMGWAKAALERNDRLEVVAADPQSRTFTVRMKDTGELRMVRVDQLLAAPAGAAAATPSTAPPRAAPAAASAAPAATPAPAAGQGAASPAEVAGAAPPAPAAEEAPAATPPQRFVSAAVRAGPSARTAGQVLEAGPGYTIEAGTNTPPASGAARGRDAGITNAPLERRHEPIVCQGARLLHIDNRNLEFDGDAVTAEDGCEIHITNSHIRATGVGVSARAANVHIDNSLIEGDSASIDASDGAQIYATASRFRGLSRRLDTAAVHDLGGNVWN
ncbi:MAG TPA: hypothetical protein VEU54_09290 [Steroidobacteraceae bacterium]|nr:hypothetical protein [Steroidobacteraceae bacterium]